MGDKKQPSLNNDSNNDESKIIESDQSTSNKPEKTKITGVSLDEFLANCKEKSVRQASNYIYVGFRKYCQIKKFDYRASNGEWLSRFKDYINKGGK